jgi:hypothetical protein
VPVKERILAKTLKKIAIYGKTPAPLEISTLREWDGKWGDHLLAMEQGKAMSEGAAI